MFSRLKKNIILNAKNLMGWKTNRKIIVFSVDDYGNVRLDSKEAGRRMENAGLKATSRFDIYDTLETRQDLQALYKVLASVKGKKGRHAVFTPFALPCNINFEKMEEEGYQEYRYELLPQTFKKLSASDPKSYENTWELWQEGIDKRFMRPQFHGREHFSLKVFNKKLEERDHELLTALKSRSYSRLSHSGYPHIRYTAAFDIEEESDLKAFKEIIESGLNYFEQVFGYRANVFTPPAQGYHESLLPILKKSGIEIIDRPLYKKMHIGNGDYKSEINYTRYNKDEGNIYTVRNVVFEPNDREIDWPSYAMKQIEAAFRWNRPAIISSHRVNFCGHISEENRNIGLGALQELLNRIVSRWPGVEFMAADELGNLIKSE